MTDIGSAGRIPADEGTAPDSGAATQREPTPAEVRAGRLSASNMLRSLAPLVLIVLLLVGWNALRENHVDPVRTIDPSSTVQLAASRASYPMLAPTGLPGGYRPTSARTDAGDARSGAPVTLQIGYVTPKVQFAQFVVSDDPRADALTSVLSGATPEGSVPVAGQTWTKARDSRGETVLSRQVGTATVLVTGSADEAELETVAASVKPTGR